jgi:hypothetical protein
VAARLDFADVLDVYSWFQRTLRFPRLTSFASERRVATFIERSEQNRGLLLELLRSADFGIVDLGLERESSDVSLPAWGESGMKRSGDLPDPDGFDDLAPRSFKSRSREVRTKGSSLVRPRQWRKISPRGRIGRDSVVASPLTRLA